MCCCTCFALRMARIKSSCFWRQLFFLGGASGFFFVLSAFLTYASASVPYAKTKIINIHCTSFGFHIKNNSKKKFLPTYLNSMLGYIEYFTFFGGCFLANRLMFCNTIFIEITSANTTWYHSLWWWTTHYNLRHTLREREREIRTIRDVHNLVIKCHFDLCNFHGIIDFNGEFQK